MAGAALKGEKGAVACFRAYWTLPFLMGNTGMVLIDHENHGCLAVVGLLDMRDIFMKSGSLESPKQRLCDHNGIMNSPQRRRICTALVSFNSHEYWVSGLRKNFLKHGLK